MTETASATGAQELGFIWIKALGRFKEDTYVDLVNVDENSEPLRERLKAVNDVESLSTVAHRHHDRHNTATKALSSVLESASNVLGNIKWLLSQIQDVEQVRTSALKYACI